MRINIVCKSHRIVYFQMNTNPETSQGPADMDCVGFALRLCAGHSLGVFPPQISLSLNIFCALHAKRRRFWYTTGLPVFVLPSGLMSKNFENRITPREYVCVCCIRIAMWFYSNQPKRARNARRRSALRSVRKYAHAKF